MKISEYLNEGAVIISESVEGSIDALTKAKGNAKIQMLKDLVEDRDLIKEIFHYAYNPYIRYNIIKLPNVVYAGNKVITAQTWSEYKDILTKLSKRELSGKKAQETVVAFLKDFTPAAGEIFKDILDKDLRIGMNAKTLNKVFAKLIPQFSVILADKLKLDKDTKLPFADTYISRKLDGVRMVAIKRGKDVQLFSRTGKPFAHFNDIRAQIAELPVEDKVFDGEVAMLTAEKKDDFAGIIKQIHRKEADINDSNTVYLIFDTLEVQDFFDQKAGKALTDRFTELKTSLGVGTIGPDEWLIPTSKKSLYMVNQRKIDTAEQMMELFNMSQKQDWEGLMARSGSAPYEFTRTKKLLKLKSFQDEEFTIVGYTEGDAGFTGMLGALFLEVDKDQEKPTECGSGYNHAERRELWQQILAFEKANNFNPGVVKNSGTSTHPDGLHGAERVDKMLKEKGITAKHPVVGKEMTVKFFEKTVDKKGNKSLRFPIFKGIGRTEIEGQVSESSEERFNSFIKETVKKAWKYFDSMKLVPDNDDIEGYVVEVWEDESGIRADDETRVKISKSISGGKVDEKTNPWKVFEDYKKEQLGYFSDAQLKKYNTDQVYQKETNEKMKKMFFRKRK